MNRVDAIRERINASLAPLALEITDDSSKHAGHASAGGGGHFRVSIVTEAFRGHGTLQRHRMVYAALADLMQQNEVHALSIDARTPDET